MTKIEQFEKKIFCLETRIKGDQHQILLIRYAMKELKEKATIRKSPVILERCIEMASGSTMEEIRGECKKQELVFCRMVLAYTLSVNGYGPTAIGKFLNRDHSSAIHLRDRYSLENSMTLIDLAIKFRTILDAELFPPQNA